VSGLLVHTTEPDGVLLARAPDQVSVIDALDAIREPAADDTDPPEVPAPVADALHRRDESVRSALGTVTLRSLATASDAAADEALRTVSRIA